MNLTQKSSQPEKLNLRRFDSSALKLAATELTSATTPKGINLAKKLAPLNNSVKQEAKNEF